MAGHSASKTGVKALMSRPSTSHFGKDVDARHTRGVTEKGRRPAPVVAGCYSITPQAMRPPASPVGSVL